MPRPKKTYFNKRWLDKMLHPGYWVLPVYGNDLKARCGPCKSEFSLSFMGKAARFIVMLKETITKSLLLSNVANNQCRVSFLHKLQRTDQVPFLFCNSYSQVSNSFIIIF